MNLSPQSFCLLSSWKPLGRSLRKDLRSFPIRSFRDLSNLFHLHGNEVWDIYSIEAVQYLNFKMGIIQLLTYILSTIMLTKNQKWFLMYFFFPRSFFLVKNYPWTLNVYLKILIWEINFYNWHFLVSLIFESLYLQQLYPIFVSLLHNFLKDI